MKRVMFWTFTFVYVATAAATLVAFLAQARVIPTGLGPGEKIPYLGLLISAVLVETVGGYLALARNLFGLKSSESEKEIRALADTAIKVLTRLQALAYRYSVDFQATIERVMDSPAGKFLAGLGLGTVSERNKAILIVTKNIEGALHDAEEVLLTDDVKRINALNANIAAVLPTLEEWLGA